MYRRNALVVGSVKSRGVYKMNMEDVIDYRDNPKGEDDWDGSKRVWS